MLIADTDRSRADAVVAMLGPTARRVTNREAAASEGLDVVVLATPADEQVALAERHLDAGHHVVATADGLGPCRELLTLHERARRMERSVAVGAALAPGLSCLIARFGARFLDVVDEIHVAKSGTGGPSCAREHHRSLGHDGQEWHDGQWHPHRGGSGRELCWFPDPVGALDCYHGALPDTLLLRGAFDSVTRITTRVSATRRDRITARLPMLRPPHPEGAIGAVRVELRGIRNGEHTAVVFGAIDRPAVAAGAVAAVVAIHFAEGSGAPGAYGLGELAAPADILRELARRGVKVARFYGLDRS